MSFTENFADISTVTQSDIDAELASIAGSESEYLSNYFFFETSFTRSNTRSQKARSIFFFANPIEVDGKRYKNYADEEVEQWNKFVDFSKELISKINTANTTMKVTFYNVIYSNAIVEELILEDFRFILISFFAVVAYLSFHLESIFLAIISMIGIGFSFPLTLFVNWYIMQVKYFGSLHLVSIFIVLGIAADDIFVFTDQWKQSKTMAQLNDQESEEDNLMKRMNFTWRRTAKAILTTSATT